MSYEPVKGPFLVKSVHDPQPMRRDAESLGPEAELASRILVAMAGSRDLAGEDAREVAADALKLACALYQGARDRGLMIRWPADEAAKTP
jgi:hypothetical protein